MISESIHTILSFGLLALICNGTAWRKGFYTWGPAPGPPIFFRHVVTVFAIYLTAMFGMMGVLVGLLRKLSSRPMSLSMMMILQLFVLIMMIVGLVVYCRSQVKTFGKIWKNPLQADSSPFYNFGFGLMTWFMAFPVVVMVGQFCDLFLYLRFGLENYEQVAVRYLKSTLVSPTLTALALTSILIIAPFIEEFLFRGTLQTYLKTKLGVKAAIALAALAFSCFHYSPEQGLGNLSLIPSLFTFGCFLGFIYERQGSLYAPIGLHVAFNLASSIRIVFFAE